MSFHSHVVLMHMGVTPLQFRKGQLCWDLGSDTYKMKVLAGGRHVREASVLRVVLRAEEYPVARTNLPYQIRPLSRDVYFGLCLLHLGTFRRLQRFRTWFGAPYYHVQPGRYSARLLESSRKLQPSTMAKHTGLGVQCKYRAN